MSRTSADRRFSKGNLANLYARNSEMQLRIIKQVPIVDGFKRVAQRKWQLLYFDDDSFAGFLMAKPLDEERGIFPGWSNAALTAKDALLLARLWWPSPTTVKAKRQDQQNMKKS